MFEQFKQGQCDVNGVTINYRQGGSGPPLLLLHGYPQTHAIWHKIADQLAERFTVVAADLRGYGDSSKPEGGENHVEIGPEIFGFPVLPVGLGDHARYFAAHVFVRGQLPDAAHPSVDFLGFDGRLGNVVDYKRLVG